MTKEVTEFVNYVWNESLGDLQDNFDIDFEREGSERFFVIFCIEQVKK